MQRIVCRDEDALRDMYALYVPRLERFLARFCDSAEIVEEVVNDTFLVVWRSAAKFRGESSPTTWIFGIAYKKTLKALQRGKSRVPVDPAYADAVDTPAQRMDLAGAIRALPSVQAAVGGAHLRVWLFLPGDR